MDLQGLVQVVLLAGAAGAWGLCGCGPGESADSGAKAPAAKSAGGRGPQTRPAESAGPAAGAERDSKAPPIDGEGPARVVFAEQRHDFGEVRGFHHLYHDFPFRVNGAGRISIDEIKSSCTCAVTAILLEGKKYEFGQPIPAGSTGKVRARLDTLGIDGLKPSTLEVITPGATVHLVLVVKGVPLFDLSPRHADVGQIRVGTAGKASVEISSRVLDRFEIIDWGRPAPPSPVAARSGDQDPRAYEIQIEEHIRKGLLRLGARPDDVSIRIDKLAPAKVRMTLTYRPRVKSGKSACTLRFLTDREASFSLQLSAYVSPLVYLEPAPMFFLGAIPRGRGGSWDFRMIDADPEFRVRIEDIEIRSAQRKHYNVVTEQLPPKDGAERVSIRLLVRDTIPPGVWGGTLIVKTNHPSFPILTTKFKGFTHNEK